MPRQIKESIQQFRTEVQSHAAGDGDEVFIVGFQGIGVFAQENANGAVNFKNNLEANLARAHGNAISGDPYSYLSVPEANATYFDNEPTERRRSKAVIIAGSAAVIGLMAGGIVGAYAGYEAGTTHGTKIAQAAHKQPEVITKKIKVYVTKTPEPAAKPAPSELPTAAPAPATPPSVAPKNTAIKVASYNVLGTAHTQPGSKDAHLHRGFASGPRRMIGSAALLKNSDIFALQENQGSQMAVLNRQLGKNYNFFYATTGKFRTDNLVGWRSDRFTPYGAHPYEQIAVPYFENNRIMPMVTLRDKLSGKVFKFMSIHNPANVGGNHEHDRAVATAIEKKEIQRAKAQGLPMIAAGDFNERQSPIVQLTAGGLGTMSAGPLKAGQRPPESTIDWIFGTTGVAFSNHLRSFVSETRKLSDHPLITANAILP